MWSIQGVSGENDGEEGGNSNATLSLSRCEWINKAIKRNIDESQPVNSQVPLDEIWNPDDTESLSEERISEERVGELTKVLLDACRRGDDKTVEMLLAGGINVNVEEELYDTPLQAASENGHYKIVKMLLAKSPDVNAQGARLYGTALQAASYNSHYKIVETLLTNHAINVNAQGGYYGNALQAACAKNCFRITKFY